MERIYSAFILPVFVLFFVTNLILGTDAYDTAILSFAGATLWPFGMVLYLAWLADLGYMLPKIILIGGFGGIMVVCVLGVFAASLWSIYSIFSIYNTFTDTD